MRRCSQGGADCLGGRKNLGHPKPVANLHPKRIFLRDSRSSKPLLIKMLQGVWERIFLGTWTSEGWKKYCGDLSASSESETSEYFVLFSEMNLNRVQADKRSMIHVLHQVWNCSFEQPKGGFGPRQNEALLASAAVRRWERRWLYCPFQLSCDFSGTFFGFC